MRDRDVRETLHKLGETSTDLFGRFKLWAAVVLDLAAAAVVAVPAGLCGVGEDRGGGLSSCVG